MVSEGARDTPLTGISSAPTVLSSIVATFSLTLYCAWPYVWAGLIVACVVTWNRVLLAILVALASTLVIPCKLRNEAFLRSWLMKTWREYFSFSWVAEERLKEDKHYVFCEVPHGAFPFGPIIAAGGVFEAFPGCKPIYALGASALYYVPLLRHFMMYLGSLPATRSNYKKLLRMGSCAVIPGGIAEMFEVTQGSETIILKRRKGMVKVAVEMGCDIVPLYYLGNTSIMHFGPQWLQQLSRKLRASIGVVYGKWGLPVPNPQRILMCVGKPIQVGPQGMSPDDPGFCARVDDVHQQLVDATQDLYYKHRTAYGWGDRPLIVK